MKQLNNNLDSSSQPDTSGVDINVYKLPLAFVTAGLLLTTAGCKPKTTIAEQDFVTNSPNQTLPKKTESKVPGINNQVSNPVKQERTNSEIKKVRISDINPLYMIENTDFKLVLGNTNAILEGQITAIKKSMNKSTKEEKTIIEQELNLKRAELKIIQSAIQNTGFKFGVEKAEVEQNKKMLLKVMKMPEGPKKVFELEHRKSYIAKEGFDIIHDPVMLEFVMRKYNKELMNLPFSPAYREYIDELNAFNDGAAGPNIRTILGDLYNHIDSRGFGFPISNLDSKNGTEASNAKKNITNIDEVKRIVDNNIIIHLLEDAAKTDDEGHSYITDSNDRLLAIDVYKLIIDRLPDSPAKVKILRNIQDEKDAIKLSIVRDPLQLHLILLRHDKNYKINTIRKINDEKGEFLVLHNHLMQNNSEYKALILAKPRK
jgi:hypothetical protein